MHTLISILELFGDEGGFNLLENVKEGVGLMGFEFGGKLRGDREEMDWECMVLQFAHL